MKDDVLGAKCLPSAAPMDQTVMPPVGFPASSVQVKAVPPHSCTSIPKCFWYQARRAAGSLAWKKMPPMPVTLFMCPSFVFEFHRSMGAVAERLVLGLAATAQRHA